MNNNLLVSIIMPAYNAERFISESIESVIRQTYTNWELLVVDDGSTDNTANIIKEYQKKDRRIFYFFQENAKLAQARNRAIDNSNGEFIAFLDSDDLWLDQKLELSLKEFYSNNQDVLFTDSYIFRDSGQLSDIEMLAHINISAKLYYGEEGLSQFLYVNRVPILTAVVKKEVILAVRGFEQGFNGVEDYNLWLKILANGYIIRGIDLKLSLYRIHENSMTSTNNLDLNVVKMFARFFSEYPQLKDKYKEQIIHWLFKILNQAGKQRELSEIFNKEILNKLAVNIDYVSFWYFIQNLLPLGLSKRILGRLLRNYQQRWQKYPL